MLTKAVVINLTGHPVVVQMCSILQDQIESILLEIIEAVRGKVVAPSF